ncbi:MAG: hypothetical protein A2Y14_00815 [Verrucomicrobia bacterium GWF2_51_19]|nr:MAG: hypothetical protein A2Y14_00815 [Verrucomicrobia bacterium GWF2_51_19]HAD82592.1 hypothetical protein [Candidatus Edwardsbacteria bacterium]
MKKTLTYAIPLAFFLTSIFYALATPDDARTELIKQWAGSICRPLTVSDVLCTIDIEWQRAEHMHEPKDANDVPIYIDRYIKSNKEFCPIIGILTYEEFGSQEDILGSYGDYLEENEDAKSKIQDFVNDYNLYIDKRQIETQQND